MSIKCGVSPVTTSSAWRVASIQYLRQLAVDVEDGFGRGLEEGRVVDADTLLVEVDCGFGCRMEQRLRLRGIDAPELKTPEGARARAFVVC